MVIGYVFNAFICVRIKLWIMLVLVTLGTLGYFATERLQTQLEKSHKHVTLTFLDSIGPGSPARASGIGGLGGINGRSRLRNQNLNGSVFSVSGMFESSI